MGGIGKKRRSALRTFERRVVYANLTNDYTVAWRTASIRGDNERPKDETLDEQYPHIVYEEDCEACELVADDPSNIQEMIRGLSSVSWQKVDVKFNSGPVQVKAHSLIQVTERARYIEGADVIQHMIDHFIT